MPDFRRGEQLAIWKCLGVAEADEHQANIMSAIAPDFVKATQSDAGFVIKTCLSEHSNVGNFIAFPIGFAENESVILAGKRLPCHSILTAENDDAGRMIRHKAAQ